MNAERSGAMAAVALLAAISLSNCTKKEYINQPITDSAHVHGTVRAWRCYVGDVTNNPRDPDRLRFSVNTSEPATVTFIRDNGFTSTVETNDSSDFDLYLSAGSHKIVVETGFTYPPDTFDNVQLKPGDTALILDIAYATIDPLNINCVFGYRSIQDTLSTKVEWGIIEELNRRSFSGEKNARVFNLEDSLPTGWRLLYREEYSTWVYVYYKLPVYRKDPYHPKLWNVWEAYEALQTIVDSDSTGSFPSNFSVEPTGAYGCLLKGEESAPGPSQ